MQWGNWDKNKTRRILRKKTQYICLQITDLKGINLCQNKIWNKTTGKYFTFLRKKYFKPVYMFSVVLYRPNLRRKRLLFFLRKILNLKMTDFKKESKCVPFILHSLLKHLWYCQSPPHSSLVRELWPTASMVPLQYAVVSMDWMFMSFKIHVLKSLTPSVMYFSVRTLGRN